MKNKITIIGIIVIFAIVGVIGYFAMTDLMQGVTLRKEVNTIGQLDITKDDIDMTIKTKGDYAVVEKTIKEYMNTYGTNCKQLKNILDDETIAKILTAENYKNDGKEFVASKEYIAKTKSEFNERINTLIEMSTEEKMMKAIEEKQLESSYVDLYKELMLGDEIKVDLQEVVKTLEEASKNVNNILDMQEKVIELLVNNKEKWNINNNNEIEFETQKLVDEYNSLINNL